MKQKFFNAAMVLVILILSFGLTNQVAAQSSENTDTKQAINGNHAQYMQSLPAGQSVYKNADGSQSTVDANGTVTVNYQTAGQNQAMVYVKPAVNTAVEMNEADMNQFITKYTNWMKANPDFKNFITAAEYSYIQESDMEHLYKSNYMVTQKLNMNNK